MLQAAIVVMTVMGCGDEGVSCDFIAEQQTTWKSRTACETAIPETLLNTQDKQYPVITASCDERIQGSTTNNASFSQSLPPRDLPTIEKAEKPSIFKLKDGYALVQDGTSDALQKIDTGYHRIEGAVKITFKNLKDKANEAVAKLSDGFNLQE